jgi:hypothetical protein
MFRVISTVAGAAAGVLALAATLPAAEAQPSPAVSTPCFRLNNVDNSRMVDPRTLLMRVSGNRIYKVGFDANCATGQTYGLVIHPVDNSGEICRAIEFNVSVRDTGEQCEPRTLTLLSPDEVAAIPAKDRP